MRLLILWYHMSRAYIPTSKRHGSTTESEINFTDFMLVNTLRLRQNGRHYADDIFKCILLNENVWITINNSLKFVPKGLINNIPALVQIMAWRRPGDKPLSEPMLSSLPTHIYVIRPQWVKPTTSQAVGFTNHGQYFTYVYFPHGTVSNKISVRTA